MTFLTIRDAVQQQYGRDLHHAVLQLEHRSPSDVTLDIHERRPEKAYDSPSFRLQGQPDPSYAVAVDLDMYACSRCGRVEFFVAGIGERFRSGNVDRDE